MADEFQQFLKDEMKKRDMSLRQFSSFIDVSHSTLSEILNESKAEYTTPKLSVLVKIARATHTDIGSLAAMLAPDVSTLTPEALVLAERIEKLPPERRRIIDALILGYAFKEIDVPEQET